MTFRINRIWTALPLLTAVALTFGCTKSLEPRPRFDALPETSQFIVAEWLYSDCGAQDGGRLSLAIADLGDAVEPVFWEAYDLGPRPSSVEASIAQIQKQYNQRQAYLRADTLDTILSPDDVADLLSVTLEEYQAHELERIRVGYKTAALLGLAIVGTTGRRALLERLAGDPESPYQVAAQQVLDSNG